MKALFLSLPLLLSAPAFAKKSCTDEPKSKWMSEEAFKKKVTEEGYKIRKFKQPGTCYEIYGQDKSGNEVDEAYLSYLEPKLPADAAVAIPRTYIFDRSGKLVMTMVGGHTEAEFQKAVAPYLK